MRKGLKVMSNNKELIQYVKSCYELEKSIYLQLEVVDYYRKKQAYFQNYQKRLQPIHNNRRTTIPSEWDVYKQNPNYKQGLYTSCSSIIGDHANEKPHSPDEVITFINATRNLKFHFWQSDRRKAEIKLEAYNNALSGDNKDIANYNEDIKQKSLKKAELVGIELNNEIQHLNQTKRILNEYYSKDIIFIKYRSLVAISAILEYLMSGRCTTLPEAYNKYEEELRQQIIIDKLDVIIDKLERIEKSQYMLYDAIISMNNTLNNISQGVDKALSSMSRIQDNTAVSAYNSKIIADNELYQSKLLTFDVTYRTLRDLQ